MKTLERGDGGREEAVDESPATPPREDTVDPQNEVRTLNAHSTTRSVSESTITDEGQRPPLPPRPVNLNLLGEGLNTAGSSLPRSKTLSRPNLQATATTGVSRTDIHTQSYPDGSRETSESTSSRMSPNDFGSIRRFKNRYGSEGDESASVRSYAPTLETGGDVESLLGEVLRASSASPAWGLLSSQTERPDPFDSISHEDDELSAEFNREFDEIGEIDSEGNNEGKWKLDCGALGVDEVSRRSS